MFLPDPLSTIPTKPNHAKAFYHTYLILMSTGSIIAEAGTMKNDLYKRFDAVKSVFVILDRYTCIEPEEYDGIKPDIITIHVAIYDGRFAYPAQPDIKISKKKHEREQKLKQQFEQSMK